MISYILSGIRTEPTARFYLINLMNAVLIHVDVSIVEAYLDLTAILSAVCAGTFSVSRLWIRLYGNFLDMFDW